MYCEIPKDCGALCFKNRFWFMFIPVFMTWGFVMLADLTMGVLTDSVMSFFYIQYDVLQDSRKQSGLQFHHIDHAFYIFCYSGLEIPCVVALVLCSHDKPFYVSFQTHTIKPLMGVFLINISLLNSMWVLVMQRFIFPSLLLLSLWLLLLLLLFYYYYYYYCCFSKSFKANIPVIWKPVGWFVLQINWLSYDGNIDLKWVNRFILNAVWESFCIFVSAILVNLRLIAMFIKTRLLLTCKK